MGGPGQRREKHPRGAAPPHPLSHCLCVSVSPCLRVSVSPPQEYLALVGATPGQGSKPLSPADEWEVTLGSLMLGLQGHAAAAAAAQAPHQAPAPGYLPHAQRLAVYPPSPAAGIAGPGSSHAGGMAEGLASARADILAILPAISMESYVVAYPHVVRLHMLQVRGARALAWRARVARSRGALAWCACVARSRGALAWRPPAVVHVLGEGGGGGGPCSPRRARRVARVADGRAGGRAHTCFRCSAAQRRARACGDARLQAPDGVGVQRDWQSIPR